MKKKIIQDIRLYRSDAQFAGKPLNAVLKRIVMKLRENEFSLGEFDHLYINFVPREENSQLYLSREADRYHPWFRICTVPVDPDFYRVLGTPDAYEGILRWVRTVLIAYFTSEEFDRTRILDCIQQAVEQGENLRMQFKEKVSATRRAVIYLRCQDNCQFRPLLLVFDKEGTLLLEKDLPDTVTLDYLGEIQLSGKRVAIKPRKNAYTAQKPPIVFEF